MAWSDPRSARIASRSDVRCWRSKTCLPRNRPRVVRKVEKRTRAVGPTGAFVQLWHCVRYARMALPARKLMTLPADNMAPYTNAYRGARPAGAASSRDRGQRVAGTNVVIVDLNSSAHQSSSAELRSVPLDRPPVEVLHRRWRQSSTNRADVRFAHPAEAEFARILSFYDVRWSYEPTSFVLQRGSAGLATESITPDFFLPDESLYIELTTMRQALVTRKNAKIRKMRTFHPDVKIKMLYRRDFERLVRSYDTEERRTGDVGEVLLDQALIEARIASLAHEIAERVANMGQLATRPLLLGVGTCVGPLLGRLSVACAGIGLECDSDRMSVARYDPKQQVQKVAVLEPPTMRLDDRLVIVVNAIVSTGMSLAFTLRWLREQGAHILHVCSLLDRRNARIVEVPIDLVGFEVENPLLVGFGLDLDPRRSGEPNIASLRPESPPRVGEGLQFP